jgi:general secretion pathway protein M
MKAYLNALHLQHWQARPKNERRTILIGAALVLPLLVYLLLWQPAHNAVAHLRESLPKLRVQVQQMNQASAQIATLRHHPQLVVMNALAVKSAIEESATRHQLALTTVTAQEPNGVRITIAAISFEKWLIWLRELQQLQHIRIDSAAITLLTEPGMVAIHATLTNGNNP